ncbi:MULTISPECIES: NAD(P)/FAD-dependent oxidoreductase [unclassified Nocardioides]|uniref:NAD(P)/FAD-dependent oxidoreductase n=1 Tax=unclassified Nocardioides TaxID=2615069 RepID=UPI00360C5965
MRTRTGRGSRAVVLGAGIGGLVAARVLADTFDEVTIVERDVMPGGGRGRRGVPQGRHVHGMQSGGLQLLGDLFPDLRTQLAEDGAREVHDLSRLWLRFSGRLLSQAEVPIAPVLSVTRPHLEWRMRQRVRGLPGVHIAEGLDVLGVASEIDGDRVRVTGARVAPAASRDAEERVIDADLVVDATGRGSRTPVWLEELGHSRPEEDRTVVQIGYASQTVRLPRAHYPQDLVIEGRAPGRRNGFAAFAGEEGRWTVSIMSYGAAEHPPTDAGERMRLLETMAPPWLVDALHAAEPVDDVARHAHPTSIWRHYERLRRHPAGLVAFGDAIAAFNPIYGTGMTVALKQALALRTALVDGPDEDLPRRFYRAAVRPLGVAWTLSNGADLAYPETIGLRTRRGMLMGRYVERFLGAAEHDPALARRFLAVVGLADPPSALLAPAAIARVLRSPTPAEPVLPERTRIAVGETRAEHVA